MRTMSFSEIRKHMSELIDPAETILLTRNGKAVSAVLSVNVYRSIQALKDVARDPERFAAAMAAHAKVQAGDYSDTVSMEELKAYLKKK